MTMLDGDVPAKTDKGVTEMKTRSLGLPQRMRTALLLVDGIRTVGELKRMLDTSGTGQSALQALMDAGLIQVPAAAAASPMPATRVEPEPEPPAPVAVAAADDAPITAFTPEPEEAEPAMPQQAAAPEPEAKPEPVLRPEPVARPEPIAKPRPVEKPAQTAPVETKPEPVAKPRLAAIPEPTPTPVQRPAADAGDRASRTTAKAAPPPAQRPPEKEATVARPAASAQADESRRNDPPARVKARARAEDGIEAQEAEFDPWGNTGLDINSRFKKDGSPRTRLRARTRMRGDAGPNTRLRGRSAGAKSPGGASGKDGGPAHSPEMRLMIARAYLANELDNHLGFDGYLLRQQVMGCASRAELEDLFDSIEKGLSAGFYIDAFEVIRHAQSILDK